MINGAIFKAEYNHSHIIQAVKNLAPFCYLDTFFVVFVLKREHEIENKSVLQSLTMLEWFKCHTIKADKESLHLVTVNIRWLPVHLLAGLWLFWYVWGFWYFHVHTILFL